MCVRNIYLELHKRKSLQSDAIKNEDKFIPPSQLPLQKFFIPFELAPSQGYCFLASLREQRNNTGNLTNKHLLFH